MPQEIDIFYKNLHLKLNTELESLEILIDDQNFSNQETYITSVSILLECALTIHPQYIIVNKLNSKFEIILGLYSFTQKNIIAPLKSDGIRKMIFLIKEEDLERYKKLEIMEPFIKGLMSKEDAIKWITGCRLNQTE
jgi:hypothetical protein